MTDEDEFPPKDPDEVRSMPKLERLLKAQAVAWEYPMVVESPSYRPKDWWNSANPEHLSAELADIDAELVEFGIDYPRGARGVADMRGFAQRSDAWLSEVAEVAREFGWKGDHDDLAEWIREHLESR